MKGIRGFTLIEVMIALAVIGIGLLVILHSVGLSLNLSLRSIDMVKGTLLAKEKITQLEREGFPPLGEEEGDFGEDYPRFRWISRVEETSLEGLRKAAVTVFWKEGKGERGISFTTYLARKTKVK